MIRRANEVPEARALPYNLPEWKHVDFDARVCVLRHVPQGGERAQTVGLTATIMRTGLRVAYNPKIGSDVQVKEIDGMAPQGLIPYPDLA